jgi:hypothetical protein
MVRLTADLIAKQAPGHNKRRADESVEHYLSRLTHLPFQNRGIESIVRCFFSLIDLFLIPIFVLGSNSTMSSSHSDLSLR